MLAEAEKNLRENHLERDLLVKVSPPIHIQVIAPPPHVVATTMHSNAFSSRATSDFVENFMSTWSRLVGDPVLSKWIIVMLAVSVSLNGYLLKGIAAGLAGKGVSGKEGVRFEPVSPPPVNGSTAHLDDDDDANIKVEPERPSLPILNNPVPTRVPKFMLEGLDERFMAQGLTLHTPASSSDGEEPPHMNGNPHPDAEIKPARRSLSECVDIFEHGPRPASVALSLLNDEEVILLAQSGRIAAYALEKFLDNGHLDNGKLERAVRIRRALICKLVLFCLLFLLAEKCGYRGSTCV